MEYKTEIMELKKNICKIKCYLFSKEESEFHKVQEKEAIRKELTKEYSPQKPIVLFINAKDITRVKEGGKLRIEFNDIDKYILSSFWQITFVDKEGIIVGIKSDEISIMKRILKAHFNSYLFDVEVISKRKQRNLYSFPIKLLLKPYKE
jgi:hypothetical protein